MFRKRREYKRIIAFVLAFLMLFTSIDLTFFADIVKADEDIVLDKGGESATFTFSENMQYITLYPGTYKLEVYGANGGDYASNTGGKGGYVAGTYTVTSKTTLSVFVGPDGNYDTSFTGSRGLVSSSGGAYYGGNGGGMSFIYLGKASSTAMSNSSAQSNWVMASFTSNILVVAGGGGGASAYASASTTNINAQTTGTASTYFGIGRSGAWGGGGGGYYGGTAGNYATSSPSGGTNYTKAGRVSILSNTVRSDGGTSGKVIITCTNTVPTGTLNSYSVKGYNTLGEAYIAHSYTTNDVEGGDLQVKVSCTGTDYKGNNYSYSTNIFKIDHANRTTATFSLAVFENLLPGDYKVTYTPYDGSLYGSSTTVDITVPFPDWLYTETYSKFLKSTDTVIPWSISHSMGNVYMKWFYNSNASSDPGDLGYIATGELKTFNIDISTLSSGQHHITRTLKTYDGNVADSYNIGNKTNSLKFYINTLPEATLNVSPNLITPGDSVIISGSLTDPEVTTDVADKYTDRQSFTLLLDIKGTKVDGTAVDIEEVIASGLSGTTYSYDLNNKIANLGEGNYTISVTPYDGVEYGTAVSKTLKVRSTSITSASISKDNSTTGSSSITIDNSTTSLYIRGNITNKNYLPGTVYYKINSGTETVLKSFTNGFSSVSFESAINFNASTLVNGSNTIEVWFKDTEGYESSHVSLKVFKNYIPEIISVPKLTIGDSSQGADDGDSIRVNTGTNIMATLEVLDFEGGKIEFYYSILDSKGNTIVSDTKLRSDATLTANVASSFKDNVISTKGFAEGNYVIKFYVKDSYGFKSNYAQKSFSINYTPVLNNAYLSVVGKTDTNLEELKLNRGKLLYVYGNLIDLDGDLVTVQYKVDNGSWNDLTRCSITNNGLDFIGTIDTSDSSIFTEGTHKIYIKLVDSFGLESIKVIDLTLNINYVPTLENLTINNAPVEGNKEVLINKGENFYLVGDIFDKDGDEIFVEYKIGETGEYKTLDITVENGRFYGMIPTDKNMESGYYTIYVRVYDTARNNDMFNQAVNVYAKENTVTLHINYPPELDSSFIIGTDKESATNTNSLKIPFKSNLYISGNVYDEELHSITISYEFKDLNGNVYTKDEVTTVKISTEETLEPFEQVLNTEDLPSGEYILTISTKDERNQIGESRTLTIMINNPPVVENLALIMDSKWNGAVYKNQVEKQPISLTFDIIDVDNQTLLWADDVTYLISIDGNEIAKVSVKKSTLANDNGKVSVTINDLQNKLGNVPGEISQADITIKVIDTYGDFDTITINKDSNGNGISIRENHNPIIPDFKITFGKDNLTGKNIYDKLMISCNNDESYKPEFSWDLDDSDINWGDDIVDLNIQYSVDNGSSWSNIYEDGISTSAKSIKWLNNTNYTRTKVMFRIIATDYFGAETIVEYGENDNIYLQKEVSPNAPGYLIITNSNYSSYFINEDYLFAWGASLDENVYDEITSYVFGYIIDVNKADDYDTNFKVLETTTNLNTSNYVNFEDLGVDSTEITFGVYSIDKYGEKSPIKKLPISFNHNTVPNQVNFDKNNFKDKTSTSLSKYGYILNGETYLIQWNDAGDNDENDYVKNWTIYYKNANSTDDWKVFMKTSKREVSFNLSSFDTEDVSELKGSLLFKIVATDTFGANSNDSATVEINFVNDLSAPTLDNKDSYLIGESSKNGQKSKFIISDESGISLIKMYYAGVEKDVLYNKDNVVNNYATVKNNGKNVTINEYVFEKNGNYSLYLEDIYGNATSIVLNISSIDLNAPVAILTPDKDNKQLTNKDVNISINMSDNVALDKLVITGINGTSYSNSIIISGTKANYILVVPQNGSYLIEVLDKAGNSYSTTYTVTNIYKQIATINDDYNNVYTSGSASFNVYSDIKVPGKTNLGSWSVVGDGDYKYEVSDDGTMVNVTVYDNGNYRFIFTDSWGNISEEHTVSVSKIMKGNIEIGVQYLVPYDEYMAKNEGANPNIVEISTEKFYVELINAGFKNPRHFVEIISTDADKYSHVFAYAMMSEKSKPVGSLVDYFGDGKTEFFEEETIFEGDNYYSYSALFKFSEDKTSTTFFAKDIFGVLSTKKASIDSLSVTKPIEINYVISEMNPTNENIEVIVYVENGYFFEDDTFYQYSKDDEILSYYDKFVWISYNETDGTYTILDETPNEKDRVAFIMEIEENMFLNIWAKNTSGDYAFKDLTITNIDKTAPSIVIEDYSSKYHYDEIIIEAYTKDYFFDAETLENTLKELYKNSEDILKALEELNISENYTVSNDGHYAYMIFNKNSENYAIFEFVAYDLATNISFSDPIDIKNIYEQSLEFIVTYKNETGTYVELTEEILNTLKTNDILDIRIATKNYEGKFYDTDNSNCVISDTNNYLTKAISENGSYTFCAIDKYNNKVYYTLEIKDCINRIPTSLNISKQGNLDEYGYYTKNFDVSISSADGRLGTFLIYNEEDTLISKAETVSSILVTLTENGKYEIVFEDIYGNITMDEIEITDIFGENYAPTLTISNYKTNPTNQSVVVVVAVTNGKFDNIEVTDENNVNIDDSNNSQIILTFNENTEVAITATNLFGNSPVTETIRITNIDKVAPNAPNKNELINDSTGLIQIKFIDNGDEGFGNKSVYYEISDGNSSKTGTLKISAILSLKDELVDGTLKIKYSAIDYAGNYSIEVVEEIISDNNKVLDFNSFYDNTLKELNRITSIIDNETRQSELASYVPYAMTIADGFEVDLNTYNNSLQRAFVQDRINTLKMLMDGSTTGDVELVNKIEVYFDRLENDITDNAFMPELKLLIESLDDASLRDNYMNKYLYYENLIKTIFVDNTNTEFAYKDSNGYIINPLSGYVNVNGIYGTYNASGMFIKGEVDRTYYYTYEGVRIKLDLTGLTYVDGNNNTVNTTDGLVNGTLYYNESGELVEYRPADGFFDFEGNWHTREGLEVVEKEDDSEGNNPSNPDDGKDDNDDNDPTTPPNPDDGKEDDDNNDEKEEIVYVDPTSIVLSHSSVEMLVGDVILVTYTLGPIGGNIRDTIVSWNTNNSSVVRVTDGNIIAIGEGTATVIAKTDNGLTAYVNVIVNKASSTDNPPKEDIEYVDPPINYPTIDDVFDDDKPIEDTETSYVPKKIGSIEVAFMTLEELQLSSFDEVYNDGYSTIILDGFGSISETLLKKADNSSMSLGIGSLEAMLILSNKDINSVTSFGFTNNGSVYNVSISGNSTLGKNSKLMIGASSNNVVYYNGHIIASYYDKNLGALVINNPLPGNYTIGVQDTSVYTYLNKYGMTLDAKGDLSYADVIKACYNCLQADDFGTLYSNIEETSDVYRQASILQKYGILDKDCNYSSTKLISGYEAYDMIYLTLSTKIGGDLNYDRTGFNLSSITLNTMNNIVKSIVEIEY